MGELGILGTLSDPSLGDLSLSPSFGGAAGFDIGVHDLLAIGFMGRLLSTKPEQDIIDQLMSGAIDMAQQTGGVQGGALAQSAVLDGRATILDLDLYPRLRLPLPIIELYGMVPIGYSNLTPPNGGASESGWNIGVAGGIGLTLVAVVQLIMQVGYTAHFLANQDVSELNINLGIALGF